MGWQKFLGGVAAAPTEAPGGLSPTADATDTETVRRIVGQLEAMPRDQARFLAAFAYILTRAAAADLDISEAEQRVIEGLVADHGSLPESHAVLVAQMARSQSLLYGGTEDYLVTRQFKSLSSDEQRLALLRCCYLVGAADDDISVAESDTLQEIASELDVDRAAVNAIRHEFEPKLSTIKAMLRLREVGPGA
ncbi:MAG: TerB family tellurite resistance protein [Chloroflexi bacterium]|nr:TerB family tellurite resistance protein [Chloroflexota bacterium]